MALSSPSAGRLFSDLWRDLRYAARTLRQQPAFTAAAVLTLALGIGATSAIFSLVDTILLRPLPFRDADRLVFVTGSYPKGAVVAMRDELRTLDVAAYSENHDINLTGRGDPFRVTATFVSAEFFAILGVSPHIGRMFAPGEDLAGRDQVVVLSHDAWTNRFAGDRSMLGRHVQLDGVSREIVGVLPADFRFASSRAEFWLPLRNDPRRVVSYWADVFMPVIGRLRRDATLVQARAELRAFQERVVKQFPWPMPPDWNRDVIVVPLQNQMAAGARTRLLMLFGAVVAVLLIACANVANLLLARAGAREKEMVLRAALGAGRRRIARQLLTESLLLASLGGGAGWLLGVQLLSIVKAALPETPRIAEAPIAWRVILFTGGLTLLTGIVFGLAPVLHFSRSGLADSWRSGARVAGTAVSASLRRALVIAEIACAALLVITAVLLLRSFRALSEVDPGFSTDRVVTARLTPNASLCEDTSRCLAFYRAVLERVQSEPGVESAALVNTPPLAGRLAKRSVNVEGHQEPAGEPAPLVWLHVISADYFRVMGIRLLSGSGFTPADTADGSLVAIVSAATAKRFWPDQNPLGKHVRFVGDTDWRRVIGVVADVRGYDLQRDLPPWMVGAVYVPHNARGTGEDGDLPVSMTIAIRTGSSQWQSSDTLRRIVRPMSLEVPVSEFAPLAATLTRARAAPAATTGLVGAFALLALVLGMVGIYGVLSFLVSHRTREIGVRVALGASRGNVVWLFMKEGIVLALAGIILGSAVALGVTRSLATELYGVSPVDPLTYLGVASVMLLVAGLACGVPTQRAIRVDPVVALRDER